jgi:hypothetical protein
VGNLHLHPLLFCLLDKRIAVVAFVRQQVLCRHALYQCASLCAICAGTVCNNYSDRQTMRIHGQMYLGVEPPFERLIA